MKEDSNNGGKNESLTSSSTTTTATARSNSLLLEKEQQQQQQQQLPPPESFFVFVVGHCEEWPENRIAQGDIGIYNEYLNLGVPIDQCMYIKDDDCTNTNCQNKLELFLQQQQQQRSEQQPTTTTTATTTTFVFYYGGHGTTNGFATIGGTWTYEQVCNTVEKLFHGDRVLFILDCCASGNLCDYLPSSTSSSSSSTTSTSNCNNSEIRVDGDDDTAAAAVAVAAHNDNNNNDNRKTKQYLLLASSPPYVTANADGEEWVLVNSWIQLMRWSGYYDNNDDDVNYNNTDHDDGSNVGVQTQRSYAPPTSNNTCDTCRIPPPSLEYQLSLLADRTAFELADQFFAYLTPSKTIRENDDDSNDNDNNSNFLIDLSWMPKRRQKRKQQSTAIATDNDDDDDNNIAVVEGSSSSSVVVPSRFPASSSISTFSLPYTSFDEPIEWQNQLPDEARMLSIDNCMVGDSVFYRHPGGIPRSSVQPSATTLISSDGKQKQQQQQDRSYYYVPPMWLVGTILSFVTVSNDDKESNKLLRIRVRYPSQQEQWEVEVSHNCLMNGFYFAQQWMLPKLFCRAQIMLAKDYSQFLDCSSLVVNTPVRVTLYKNDGRNNDDDGDILTTREGIILDWRYFNWKNHIISCHPSDGLVVANTKYDELYFDELPVSIKAFARSLGYTKSSWDNDTEIPADTKDWDELTEFEKEAATMLGYVRQKRSTASVDDDDDSNDLNPFRIAGAVVPVKWNDGNQQSCLVPLKHIVYPEIKLPSSITTVPTSSSSEKERPQQFNNELTNLQRQTLLRKSLKASGKSIGNAKSIMGTARLSAYWPDDGDFYDAVSIDEDDDALSLELLTSHFEFTLPGIYCPILYEDGEMHLTPISYIFKRGDQKRRFSNYVDDDSDSDEEKDQKAVSSSFPTDESINTMSTLLLDISRQTLSFGEHYSDIATQLEYASHSLHAAFEKKNKDDKRNKRTDQFEEPKNSIISLSATITASTTASNSTGESCETCSNASVDDADMTTTTTTNNNYPSENKSYINYDWTDLPENIKNAAQRIGYNKKIWNTDGDLSINEKEWNDLNSKEQQDLKTIGYSEASWDMEDSSEDDDDDDDDSDDSDN